MASHQLAIRVPSFLVDCRQSLDALRAVRYRSSIPRIRLIEPVIGSIWVAIGAFVFVTFLVIAGIKRDLDSTRIAAAGGLWALLGALSLIARFRQNRFPRLQNAAATIQ